MIGAMLGVSDNNTLIALICLGLIAFARLPIGYDQRNNGRVVINTAGPVRHSNTDVPGAGTAALSSSTSASSTTSSIQPEIPPTIPQQSTNSMLQQRQPALPPVSEGSFTSATVQQQQQQVNTQTSSTINQQQTAEPAVNPSPSISTNTEGLQSAPTNPTLPTSSASTPTQLDTGTSGASESSISQGSPPAAPTTESSISQGSPPAAPTASSLPSVSYAAALSTTDLVSNTGEFGYLADIQKDCGDLCGGATVGVYSNGPFFQQRRTAVKCDKIMVNALIDRPNMRNSVVEDPPADLVKHFTLGGEISYTKRLASDANRAYLKTQARNVNWTREWVEDMRKKCGANKYFGNYGYDVTSGLLRSMKESGFEGAERVLVIGSENPWVESCALAAGAKNVVTLEYGKIASKHEQISTMTPTKFREAYAAGTLGTFDHVVTYSSVEHSGLGRYGDAVNPWGDILAIARAWCVTKPSGRLIIGVPTWTGGLSRKRMDELIWNRHRVYGVKRYTQLATNYKQISRIERGKQPIYIFEKIDQLPNNDVPATTVTSMSRTV